MDRSREDLLDLSEGGALLVMSMSPARENTFRLTIEWTAHAVQVTTR